MFSIRLCENFQNNCFIEELWTAVSVYVATVGKLSKVQKQAPEVFC